MSFEHAIASAGVWALPMAAAGGVIAALNPCCLALYPAVGASCCVNADGSAGRVVFSRALLLVLGAALGTTILGVAAALAGHAVTTLSRGARYGLAFVPIVAGLHLGGLLRIPLPASRPRLGPGAVAAFGTGVFLSGVVSVCGTPVLAAVLSYAAYEGASLSVGYYSSATGSETACHCSCLVQESGSLRRALARESIAGWMVSQR